MADIELRVRVAADGSMKLVAKDIERLGDTTRRTSQRTSEAAESQSRLNHRMNQGVAGSANASRSFSKLNQTIGSGNGGLVGAYAALAANAFAVSAAFNALRTAVQTEQLLQGLEVQGAKTGRTLTTVAQNIRQITEGSISSADAMKAAAQGSAAGLSARDLEDLTQVATNAAKVLGRNLPDAMERVIKGVTKLEPELLDELGLMTKLTEASEAYARQQGKSAAALTNFEKRRAFAEAIKKEGETKFGGIEGQVDVNQLDKVAAKFDDLVNSALRFITALAPVRLIFERLTDSTTGLLSLLLLFGATIRKQLLGTFADIAARATKAAESVRNDAKKLNKDARAAVASSTSAVVNAQRELTAAAALSKRAPAGFKQNIADMVAGKATADQYKASIDSLTRSNTAFDKTIKSGSAEKAAAAKEEKVANNLRIQAIKDTEAAQKKAAESQKRNYASLLNASVANKNALKQEFVANALNAASNLNLAGSYNAIIKAMVMAYRESRTQTQATMASAAAAGTAAPLWASLQTRFQSLGVVASGLTATMFGLGLAAKTVAVGLVASLNIASTLLSVFSIGEMVYKKFFETESDRRKKKAIAELGQVLDSTAAKWKEYNRVLSSNLDLSDKVITSNIIKANSFVELAIALTKSSEEYQRNLDIQEKISKKREQLDKKMTLETLVSPLPSSARIAERELLDIAEDTGIDPNNRVFQRTAGRIKGFGFDWIKPLTKELGLFDQGMLDQQKSLDNLIRLYPELETEILKSTEGLVDANQAYNVAIKVTDKFISKVQAQASGYENLKSQLEAVEQSSATLSRSLKVTTPYDDQLEKVVNLERAFRELSFASKRISGEELAKVNDALTKVPASFAATMSVSTQSALDSFSAISFKINELIKQRDIILAKDGARADISGINAELMAAQRDQISIRNELVESVPKEISSYKTLLADNQKMVILQGAQVTLAQARLGALQRQGIVTGEDVRKQLNLQNAIVDKQIQQEKASLRLLETEGSRLNFRETQIAQEEKILELMIKQGDAVLKASLEQEKAAAIAAKDKTAELAAISKINAFEKAARARDTGQLTPAEQAILKAREREDLERERAVNDATIKAKQAGIQALGLGKTTSAEISAAETSQNLTNLKTITQLQNESKNIALETQDIEASIADFKSGGLNTLKLEFESIKRNNEEKLKQLKVDQQFKVREIEINLEKARSLNNASQVKFYTDLLNVTKERNTSEIKNTEAKNQQTILDKIGLSREEDRLSLLRESLSIQERIQSVIVDNIRSQADLANITRRLELRRLGVSDETLSRGEEIANAETALKIAEQERDMKVALIKLEFALLEAKRQQSLMDLKARLGAIDDERKRSGDPSALSAQRSTILSSIENLGGTLVNGELKFGESILKYADKAAEVIENGVKIAAKTLENARFKRRASGTGDIVGETRGITENVLKEFGKDSTEALPIAGKLALTADIVSANMSRIRDSLMELGPEGALVIAIGDGIANLSGAFSELGKATNSKEMLTAGLNAASAVLSTISSITKASSDAKIASVDREIAAEQKRDGKSAESIAKLQALEKKKDDIARKSFNTQKKLMMAQAVMSTAAGIASVLASPMLDPISKIVFAGIIGAMGAAQIAVIAGTQYQSSSSASSVQPPSSVSIGKRSDTVDLARGPSAQAGGEAGFIRGSQGFGSNASNFRTIGSAYGGDLMRGYGNRGFVVGEKGPEILSPETPINVTPANDVMPSAPVNATINIQALDASAVQDVLLQQKGNIISMIRSAANASGQGFLEDVNVNVYTRPQVNKL